MSVFSIPATVYIGAVTTTTGTGGTLITNAPSQDISIIFQQATRERRRLNRQLLSPAFQYGDVQIVMSVGDQIQKTTDLLLPLFFGASGAIGNQNATPLIDSSTQRLLIVPRTNRVTPAYYFYSPRVRWSNANEAATAIYSQVSPYWSNGTIIFDCVSLPGDEVMWTLGTAAEINTNHSEITS